MLLYDLLKLFENNFNINEERFISIIESNNIKLNQRLLVELNVQKKTTNNVINNETNKNIKPDISTTNTNTSNINTNTSNINTNNNSIDDVSEINLKKEHGGRGRGRPRKTCKVKEDDSVLVEVEIIILEGEEYYKTNENVILSKDLVIEGILKDGKIVRHEK